MSDNQRKSLEESAFAATHCNTLPNTATHNQLENLEVDSEIVGDEHPGEDEANLSYMTYDEVCCQILCLFSYGL